jgi:hypothetical protein
MLVRGIRAGPTGDAEFSNYGCDVREVSVIRDQNMTVRIEAPHLAHHHPPVATALASSDRAPWRKRSFASASADAASPGTAAPPCRLRRSRAKARAWAIPSERQFAGPGTGVGQTTGCELPRDHPADSRIRPYRRVPGSRPTGNGLSGSRWHGAGDRRDRRIGEEWPALGRGYRCGRARRAIGWNSRLCSRSLAGRARALASRAAVPSGAGARPGASSSVPEAHHCAPFHRPLHHGATKCCRTHRGRKWSALRPICGDQRGRSGCMVRVDHPRVLLCRPRHPGGADLVADRADRGRGCGDDCFVSLYATGDWRSGPTSCGRDEGFGLAAFCPAFGGGSGPSLGGCECEGWEGASQRQPDPPLNSSIPCVWRSWWGAKRRRSPGSSASWCSCSLAPLADQASPARGAGDHAEQRSEGHGPQTHSAAAQSFGLQIAGGSSRPSPLPIRHQIM